MTAVEEKKQRQGFLQRLLGVENPLKYGILGAALYTGIALLKTFLAPELFAVAQAGAVVGGVIGIVNNFVSAISSL